MNCEENEKMNCNCSITTWPYVTSSNKIIKFQKKKAGGILIHDDRVLLVQSRGNMWGFPKGSIEDDESILECAIREVKEETSLFIIFTFDDKNYFFNNTLFFQKNLHSIPQIDSENIKKNKDNDCSGIGWVNLECLKKMRNKSLGRAQTIQSEGTGSDIDLKSVNLDSICEKCNANNMILNSSLKKFIKTL